MFLKLNRYIKSLKQIIFNNFLWVALAEFSQGVRRTLRTYGEYAPGGDPGA